MLPRTTALEHPRIAGVWEVIDFIVTTDPVVSAHVYGAP
jgi:hypothetical protein